MGQIRFSDAIVMVTIVMQHQMPYRILSNVAKLWEPSYEDLFWWFVRVIILVMRQKKKTSVVTVYDARLVIEGFRNTMHHKSRFYEIKHRSEVYDTFQLVTSWYISYINLLYPDSVQN
jgi:hypothetical protein